MLALTYRVLTFRLTPEEFDQLGFRHLLFGLATAWIVGYGRWWDRPDDIAPFLRSGAFSVLIVLGLGIVLHVIITALAPRHGGLIRTTAYISLTSLPAAVYALPLESWMSLEQARLGNVAMLALVATWRVALYVYLLRRIAGFRLFTTIVTAALPLALVLFVLAINGLMFSVIDLMTGERPAGVDATTAETRYEIIERLFALSIYVAPVAFVAWIVLAIRGPRLRDQASSVPN